MEAELGTICVSREGALGVPASGPPSLGSNLGPGPASLQSGLKGCRSHCNTVNCIGIYVFFKKKYFKILTKFTTQNIEFKSTLNFKKLKMEKKYFPTPYLTFLDKIGGSTATKCLGQKVFFAAPF